MLPRRNTGIAAIACVVSGLIASPMAATADTTLLGPSPYLSFADSPWNGLSFSQFYLEDFEDHLLDTPGVSADAGGVTSVVFGPSIHDSVDADDGAIDGSGLQGDSYFSSSGATGVTFSFDAGVLGGLPTHAGIVWTDGAGTVTFQAFGPGGTSLGTIGPISDPGVFPNNSFNGETAEDRFFGVINPGGVSAIHISNSSGGIEADHLQYGLASATLPPNDVPEPGSLALAVGVSLSGLAVLRRRRR